MAKKTKDLKVTDAELKSLQTKVQIINQAQMQIGGLEVQKTNAVAVIQNTQQELSLIQAELEKKYGNVVVNIETGLLRDREDASNKKN
tara:strand:- start:364 stop:627 length:264 start_codon:yes stop_codon:yes gene_type:complete